MKRALPTLACAALVAGVHAAQPAVPKGAAAPQAETAAGSSTSTRAGPVALGRLFFSPSERAQLDAARLQKKAPAAANAPEAVVEAAPPPQIVTYGGIVRRSDGRQMLWLNNKLVDAKEGLAGLSLKGNVRSDGAVTLQTESGATVDVKVGQSVEIQSGKVAEARKPAADAAPPPDAQAPAADGRSAAAESKGGAPESKPGGAPPTPPVTESTEKKPAPGSASLKAEPDGRPPPRSDAERISRTTK